MFLYMWLFCLRNNTGGDCGPQFSAIFRNFPQFCAFFSRNFSSIFRNFFGSSDRNSHLNNRSKFLYGAMIFLIIDAQIFIIIKIRLPSKIGPLPWLCSPQAFCPHGLRLHIQPTFYRRQKEASPQVLTPPFSFFYIIQPCIVYVPK